MWQSQKNIVCEISHCRRKKKKQYANILYMKRCGEEVTAADSNNEWNMGGSDGVCQISDSKIKRSIKTASNMIDMSQKPIYSLKSSKWEKIISLWVNLQNKDLKFKAAKFGLGCGLFI